MLGAFLAAVLVSATIALAAIGAAALARHRAQSGADLAALAVALALPAGPAPACDRARAQVGAMRMTLAGCLVDQLDAVVTVDVPVRVAGWDLGTARAVARAGPVGPG